MVLKIRGLEFYAKSQSCSDYVLVQAGKATVLILKPNKTLRVTECKPVHTLTTSRTDVHWITDVFKLCPSTSFACSRGSLQSASINEPVHLRYNTYCIAAGNLKSFVYFYFKSRGGNGLSVFKNKAISNSKGTASSMSPGSKKSSSTEGTKHSRERNKFQELFMLLDHAIFN